MASAAALAIVDPDAFTDARWIDAGAHFVDDASAVAVGDDERRLHGIALAASAIGIRWLYARRLQPHADLATAWLRQGLLAHFEDRVGGSRPVVPNCAHRLSYRSDGGFEWRAMFDGGLPSRCRHAYRSHSRTATGPAPYPFHFGISREIPLSGMPEVRIHHQSRALPEHPPALFDLPGYLVG
jgi:predicted Rdx family selenoprotein